MTDLGVGVFVRHTKSGEWGDGVILRIAEGKVAVLFERAGEKSFTRDDALTRLAILPDGEVPATSALRQPISTSPPGPARKPRASPRTARAAGPSCTACGGPRAEAQRRERWKSCPKCSQVHGTQHVFRPDPDGFGISMKRPNDGIQSQCRSCRAKREPSFERPEVRFCSDLQKGV
jgi:hypothetical protein